MKSNLYSIRIRSTDTRQLFVNGRNLHGLWFSLLALQNASLTERLHAAQEKPFALWPSVDGADSCVSTLSDELSAAVDGMIATQPLAGRLGAVPVTVEFKRERSVTWQTLWENSTAMPQPSNFRIKFVTPTSFRRSGEQILFPEPALVLQSLYNKAVSFGGDWCKENLAAYDELAQQVRVSRYSLETEEVEFGRYKIIGFVGTVIFDSHRISTPYHRHTLRFLADISTFTGVGYKTTMGLGRVECAVN